MIKGIGIDICQMSRIKLSLSKKILSQDEMPIYEQIHLEKRKIEFLAGRFAAKEAIYKALSFQYPTLGMTEVTVLNDGDGRPQVVHPHFENLKVWISISHEKDYAVAQAIVEEE